MPKKKKRGRVEEEEENEEDVRSQRRKMRKQRKQRKQRKKGIGSGRGKRGRELKCRPILSPLNPSPFPKS
jgi:hypothetical protein